MTFGRRLLARIASIALVATLAAALAPGLSHAMRAAAAPDTWGEVCRAIPGADLTDSEPAAPGLGSGATDCPFCLPHGGHCAPPPARSTFVSAPAESPALPRRFLHAPSASDPWRAAQPRAPPVVA